MECDHRLQYIALACFLIAIFLSAVYSQPNSRQFTRGGHPPSRRPYSHHASHRRELQDEALWTTWSHWTPCSMTCGRGVRSRYRGCVQRGARSLVRQTDDLCKGKPREYQICEEEKCAMGSGTPREFQCAQQNKKEVNAVLYEWTPLGAGVNQCELTCMASGFAFYNNFGLATDGTPCGRDATGHSDGGLEESRVCINGTCQTVGCDEIVDSGTIRDRCRVCGGENKDCYHFRNSFMVLDPPGEAHRRYQDMLVIPEGATHVEVTDHSDNYLALSDGSGTYILNGNLLIDWPGKYQIDTSIIQYERRGRTEILTIEGPTTKNLTLKLLFRKRNPGVHFEFYIPTEKVDQIVIPEPYFKKTPQPTYIPPAFRHPIYGQNDKTVVDDNSETKRQTPDVTLGTTLKPTTRDSFRGIVIPLARGYDDDGNLIEMDNDKESVTVVYEEPSGSDESLPAYPDEQPSYDSIPWYLRAHKSEEYDELLKGGVPLVVRDVNKNGQVTPPQSGNEWLGNNNYNYALYGPRLPHQPYGSPYAQGSPNDNLAYQNSFNNPAGVINVGGPNGYAHNPSAGRNPLNLNWDQFKSYLEPDADYSNQHNADKSVNVPTYDETPSLDQFADSGVGDYNYDYDSDKYSDNINLAKNEIHDPVKYPSGGNKIHTSPHNGHAGFKGVGGTPSYSQTPFNGVPFSQNELLVPPVRSSVPFSGAHLPSAGGNRSPGGYELSHKAYNPTASLQIPLGNGYKLQNSHLNNVDLNNIHSKLANPGYPYRGTARNNTHDEKSINATDARHLTRETKHPTKGVPLSPTEKQSKILVNLKITEKENRPRAPDRVYVHTETEGGNYDRYILSGFPSYQNGYDRRQTTTQRPQGVYKAAGVPGPAIPTPRYYNRYHNRRVPSVTSYNKYQVLVTTPTPRTVRKPVTYSGYDSRGYALVNHRKNYLDYYKKGNHGSIPRRTQHSRASNEDVYGRSNHYQTRGKPDEVMPLRSTHDLPVTHFWPVNSNSKIGQYMETVHTKSLSSIAKPHAHQVDVVSQNKPVDEISNDLHNTRRDDVSQAKPPDLISNIGGGDIGRKLSEALSPVPSDVDNDGMYNYLPNIGPKIKKTVETNTAGEEIVLYDLTSLFNEDNVTHHKHLDGDRVDMGQVVVDRNFINTLSIDESNELPTDDDATQQRRDSDVFDYLNEIDDGVPAHNGVNEIVEEPLQGGSIYESDGPAIKPVAMTTMSAMSNFSILSTASTPATHSSHNGNTSHHRPLPVDRTSCPKCTRVRNIAKNFCHSDIVARITVHGTKIISGEMRHRVTIEEIYHHNKMKFDINHIWISNKCWCPRLKKRTEYLVMGTISEGRFTVSKSSYSRKFKSHLTDKLSKLTGTCSTS